MTQYSPEQRARDNRNLHEEFAEQLCGGLWGICAWSPYNGRLRTFHLCVAGQYKEFATSLRHVDRTNDRDYMNNVRSLEAFANNVLIEMRTSPDCSFANVLRRCNEPSGLLVGRGDSGREGGDDPAQ